jgi:hypothetical protein
MALFRVATDGRYEVVDRDGEIVHVYDRLGHSLHHVDAGHPIGPSCCPAVNRNGDVVVRPNPTKPPIAVKQRV